MFQITDCDISGLQVLSLMLGQAGLHLHTFPEVAFRLDKWTMQGYPCVLDKTPNRQLDIHVSTASPCFGPFKSTVLSIYPQAVLLAQIFRSACGSSFGDSVLKEANCISA